MYTVSCIVCTISWMNDWWCLETQVSTASTYQIVCCINEFTHIAKRHARIQCLRLTGKIVYTENWITTKWICANAKSKDIMKKPVHQIQQTSFVFLSYLLIQVFFCTYLLRLMWNWNNYNYNNNMYVLITTRARSRHSWIVSHSLTVSIQLCMVMRYFTTHKYSGTPEG